MNDNLTITQSVTLPASLLEAAEAGTLIPFVGAGVSMAVLKGDGTKEGAFPNWKQLLEHAANAAEKEGHERDAAFIRLHLSGENPEYLKAADSALTSLRRDGLGRVIKRLIDVPRSSIDSDSLWVGRMLWSISPGLLITTNYDKVLKWSSPVPDDVETWDIEAGVEMSIKLRGVQSTPAVWHLHGTVENVANIVLTPTSYEELYTSDAAESKYKAAVGALQALLITKVLLFVGTSLNDKHLTEQLNRLAVLFQGTSARHYIILHEDEKLPDMLKANLQAIYVSNFEEDLKRTLSRILEAYECGAASKRWVPNFTGYGVEDAIKPSAFNVPYKKKGEALVGREQYLEQIANYFWPIVGGETERKLVLQGLGGLGKTQLAVEYAIDFASRYKDGVIWINAEQDLEVQLIEINLQLTLSPITADRRAKLAASFEWLRGLDAALVVVDNVSSPEIMDSVLGELQASNHVIVTSRKELIGFKPLGIDPLSEDESVRMLLQGSLRQPSTSKEEQDVRAIAEILGGLPLALEIASAYLRYRDLAFGDYLHLLRANLTRALPGKFLRGGFTRHSEDVYATVRIDREIFDDEPLCEGAFNILVLSGRTEMSSSLLSAMLGEPKSGQLAGSLALGTSLRIFHRSAENDSYSVHRLVRDVSYDEVVASEDDNALRQKLQRLISWFEGNRRSRAMLQSYESQIEHLEAWIMLSRDRCPELLPYLVWLKAYPPYHRDRYEEAFDLVREAESLLLSMEDPAIRLRAELANDYRFLYGELGKWELSQKKGEEALQLSIQAYGETSPQALRRTLYLASVEKYRGRREKAIAMSQGVLDIVAQNEVLDISLETECRTALADLLQDSNPDEAVRTIEVAVKLLESAPANADINNVAVLETFSRALWKAGRFEEAGVSANRALHAARSYYGEVHRRVGDLLRLSAVLAMSRHDEALAREFIQDAATMIEGFPGDVISKAEVLFDWAGIEAEVGNMAEAWLKVHAAYEKLRALKIAQPARIVNYLVLMSNSVSDLNALRETFTLLERVSGRNDLLPGDLDRLESCYRGLQRRFFKPGSRLRSLKNRGIDPKFNRL